MPSISIYSWSHVDTNGLPEDQLRYDTMANDPSAADYDPNRASWTDRTYTYLGGKPQQIFLSDDDDIFEDGYTETGSAATLVKDVTINGVTYPAGSVVENEFSLIDSDGNQVWVIRINGENVGFAPSSTYSYIPAGTTFHPTESRDGDPVDSSDGVSSAVSYGNIICFAAETRILSPDGPRAAAAFGPGDLVTTRDRGARPVLWAGRTEAVFAGPDDPARPVLLRAGALGAGLPRADLVLSPQHRVMLCGSAARQLTGHDEVLAPVKGLLSLPGIRILRGRARETYVHLLLDRHDILSAEGAPAESLWPGPMALSSLAPAQRAALLDAVPPGGIGPPARHLLRVNETRRLARKMARSGVFDADAGRRAIAAG